MVEMDTRRTLPSPERSDWKETIKWMIFNLVGGLMPIYLGGIVLLIWSESVSWSDFFRHGELVVYSAALLASTLYELLRERYTPFPYRHGLGLGMLVLLMFAVTVFIGVTVMSKLKPPVRVPAIDIGILAGVSVGVLVGTVLVAFFCHLYEQVRAVQDVVHATREKELSDLQKEFRETREHS